MKSIYITQDDMKVLRDLIDYTRSLRGHGLEQYLRDLESELNRAFIVPAELMPAGVVTVDSIVHVKDLDSHEVTSYILALPHDEDIGSNRISVFSPMGTALLGYPSGSTFQWKTSDGTRRLKILAVEQMIPEAAGRSYL